MIQTNYNNFFTIFTNLQQLFLHNISNSNKYACVQIACRIPSVQTEIIVIKDYSINV